MTKKIILLLVLLIQALCFLQKIRVNYYDEIILPPFDNTTNVNVTITSFPGNDPTIPITVGLREITDANNPLVSTQLDSQLCTFPSGILVCNVTLNSATSNNSKKHTIRLSEISTIHYLGVSVLSKQNKRLEHTQRYLMTTPEGATNPGFKFYNGAGGQWTTNFTISSHPAPNISSFDFTLWELNGNQFNMITTDPVYPSASNSIQSATFSIPNAGNYYLSFNL
jgi:hypothetical protein